MYHGGFFRQISTNLNIAYWTIHNLWIKFVKTNSILDLSKSSRPLKSTAMERRLIYRISKKDHFLTANEVRGNCNILQKVYVYCSQIHLHCWNFSEEGHRRNHCYLCNIFKIGKGCARHTYKWTRWSERYLFFLIKAASKHMLICPG